ncbi:MAG: flavin monoamine oxidase family protein [Vicinamibacterales bacterium]
MATRRDFLIRVGRAGGVSAAFAMMQALDLMPGASEIAAAPLDLPPASGAGTTVAVLGAGIAGLVSAYELRKAGYEVTVIEARARPGGRNWTIRNGTTVEFLDGTTQRPDWQASSYFNAGPARIPSIHTTMLDYCRTLGVALEVEVNSSRSALLVSDRSLDDAPIEQRQAINDTRGQVSELLAKCLRQHALDQQLTSADQERLLAFLRVYGDLTPDYLYKGSERAGLARTPGAADQTGELRDPLPLAVLLDSGFWRGLMFEEQLDMQATMFQPVGGMDQIPYAFAKALGSVVTFEAPITAIGKTASGVRIAYRHRGTDRQVDADYCVCALPVTALKRIPNDFSAEVRRAIDDTSYDDAYKIAWEAPRFWETESNIFGGISFLGGGPIGLVWYPSGDLFSRTGVLVSGYAVESGTELGMLPNLQAKLDASRRAVDRLHPTAGARLTQPVYVNWGQIASSEGSWVRRTLPGDATAAGPTSSGYHEGAYRVFNAPDDRIYFSGDHCSRVGAWQEGAALSAHRTVRMIHERVQAERLTASRAAR